MDAAELRVRQNGFDGFSYADLADEIGIRKASIHYHFPSKADLSAAIMKRYRDGMETFCGTIDDAAQTGAERICRMIARYRGAVGTGERVCLCVAFIAGVESLDDETLSEITGYRAMMRDWLARAVGVAMGEGSLAAGDATAEAAGILALLEGAQLAARASGQPAMFDEAVAPLRARLGC